MKDKLKLLGKDSVSVCLVFVSVCVKERNKCSKMENSMNKRLEIDGVLVKTDLIILK